MADHERDNGFQSGPWTGFYTQDLASGSKFHRMHLQLEFAPHQGVIDAPPWRGAAGGLNGGGGHISGHWHDDVGPFTIAGSYDLESRHCWWTKAYSTHTVRYQGSQADRWISGQWEIRAPHVGDFRIWPENNHALSSEFFLEESQPRSERWQVRSDAVIRRPSKPNP